MSQRQVPRCARTLGLLALVLALAACTHLPRVPYTPAPQIGQGYPEKLGIAEPGAEEVVVVINDNLKMAHAGMFVGEQLLDPAGSYEQTRRRQAGWQTASLQDYLRFQLDDGPAVRLYRFSLSDERFAQVKARLEDAGRTLPLFCAAKVQNILSGIAPFESVPDVWMITPATLARRLDAIIGDTRGVGTCLWPDGSPCYPQPVDETPGVAIK